MKFMLIGRLILSVLFITGHATLVAEDSLTADAELAPATQASKACDTPEYRQFDFWIGTWRVTTPDGEYAGKNTITPILNECVLHESWTGRSGYRGESFNIYDAAINQWHQTWVDHRGGILMGDGGLVNGRMVLSGAGKDADGKTIVNRITWTPYKDGSVRQHWEVSADESLTWTTVFDGLYKKLGE